MKNSFVYITIDNVQFLGKIKKYYKKRKCYDIEIGSLTKTPILLKDVSEDQISKGAFF